MPDTASAPSTTAATAPLISVIIPTFRRPKLLAAALASLGQSKGCRPDDVEVIVVDNNSRDTTPDVVHAAAKTSPFRVAYVLETTQGVSFARNRGAAEAAGAFLCYMDEDQLIDPDYLARIPAAFQETKAECVGGWLGYRDAEKFPAWLWTVVGRVGQRDFGPAVRPLGMNDGRLAGGNMVIRRSAFERLGGFRTDVGPSSKGMTYGEDLELQDRIIRGGGGVFYDPALRQLHCLEDERMKRSYYLRRAYQAGRGEYRVHHQEWANAPRMLGLPRFLIRRTATSALKAAAGAFAPSAQRFNLACRFASDLGHCREAVATQETGTPG